MKRPDAHTVCARMVRARNAAHARVAVVTMLVASATLAQPKPPAQPADTELVDAFVARVGARVITAAEVILETHIGMVTRFGAEAARTPIAGDLFETATTAVVVHALADDAARARGFITTEEAVAKAIARFELRFSGPAAYQAFLVEHDAVDEEVRRVMRRNLRVDALVKALASEATGDVGAAELFDQMIEREQKRTDVRVRAVEQAVVPGFTQRRASPSSAAVERPRSATPSERDGRAEQNALEDASSTTVAPKGPAPR